MLLVDGIIFSLQREGGISVYFRELLAGFSKANLPASIQVYDENAAARLSGNGFPVLNQKARHLERYRRCKIQGHYQLFHSSYYRLPTTRLPIVTTVYDFVYERCLKGPRRWVHSVQKFAAIRQSDAVICISNSTRHDLGEFLPDVPADRIKVIHLGVSDVFQPLSEPTDSPSTRPFVLFVGARDRYKNFWIVATALSRLPDLRLVLVGGGALLEREIRHLDHLVTGRYEYLGNVESRVLNQLYSAAVCLVYPSSYEGFGIPVVEAMRCGCPVVAVRASSIPEVAGDAALLLDAPDPDLVCAAIQRLLQPIEREAFRKRGILRAREFSWEKTFKETIGVYETLIGRPLRVEPSESERPSVDQ